MRFDHRVAVVVLIKGDRFLLQHRDANAPFSPSQWGFFGGHINEGETPEDAVIRETREELQIDIEPTFFGRYASGREHGSVERFVFTAPLEHPVSELKRLLTEGDDVGLFSLEELNTLTIDPDRVRILQAIAKKLKLSARAPRRRHP